MLKRFLARRRRPDWVIRVTTPDGVLIDITTGQLEALWRMGGRSTDGYADLLAGHRAGWHVWVKPEGWTEPDERLAALDGTGAILPGRR